jgi:xylulokinase
VSLLLGLDIGTTSTIGILIDTDGGVAATASRPSALVSRHANWAEEDPALWWSNVCAIVPALLAKSGIAASEIAAVGVTGMVPTVILLDENREPLRHSIQQNDARALDEIEAMKRAIDPDDYFARTGGSINQQLVAPKLRWLERHEPDCMVRARTVLGSYDYVTPPHGRAVDRTELGTRGRLRRSGRRWRGPGAGAAWRHLLRPSAAAARLP